MSDFEQALAKEIARLKERLEHLVGLSSAPTRAQRGRPRKKHSGAKLGRAKTAEKGSRRKKPVSAARRKQMAEHGAYLGSVRPLSKANRAKVKAIRQRSGIQAAIAHAKKLAAK
jgi:hypothetical protein